MTSSQRAFGARLVKAFAACEFVAELLDGVDLDGTLLDPIRVELRHPESGELCAVISLATNKAKLVHCVELYRVGVERVFTRESARWRKR